MSYPHTKDIEKMMKSDPKMFKSHLLVMTKKSKHKALEKAKSSAFDKQQNKIAKERKEYAKKYPGTYKGRPIHELRKEAMLD